jgi:nucleolar protein 53
MSYNPTYDEHQDLLAKANQIEMAKLKKEERLVRNHDAKIPKMSHKEIEDIWLTEMSGSLVDMKNREPEADIDDDLGAFKPKKQQKKGKKQKILVMGMPCVCPL